jgi:hypothetical protein
MNRNPYRAHPARLAFTALTYLALAGAATAAPAVQAEGRVLPLDRPFRWEGSADARTLEIKLILGSVRIEPSNGRNFEVTATPGDPDLASRIALGVSSSGSKTLICTTYPDARQTASATECAWGNEGRFSSVLDQQTVEVVVRVPRGGRLIVRNVNGTIEASDLAGELEVQTVTGQVSVSRVSGKALRIRTVSGSVALFDTATDTSEVKTLSGEIRYNGPVAGERHKLETYSGAVGVLLEAGANAELRVDTTSGKLALSPRLTTREGDDERNYRLGAGGPLVEISTFSGAIRFDVAE